MILDRFIYFSSYFLACSLAGFLPVYCIHDAETSHQCRRAGMWFLSVGFGMDGNRNFWVKQKLRGDPYRIGSMGLAYLSTCTIENQPNVGKYTIHGSYGYGNVGEVISLPFLIMLFFGGVFFWVGTQYPIWIFVATSFVKLRLLKRCAGGEN